MQDEPSNPDTSGSGAPTSAPAVATGPDVDQDELGQRLKRVIDAAKESRKSFMEMGDEINKYAYDPQYEFLYQDWESDNGELFHKAKVSLAAQFVELMGPYLYQYNPTYRLTPKPTADPAALARIPWEEAYLNWAAKRQNLYREASRTVNQSLVYGRSVVWTGYNERRKCIAHQHGSIRDLFLDPDAVTLDDCNVKIRRRYKPRWEALNCYPKAGDTIREMSKAKDLPSHMKEKNHGASQDIVVYYEMYCRVGAERWMPLAKQSGTIDDSPMKYIVSDDGKILDVLPWEIPFWRDDLWPCEELDLRELPDAVWPASPLEPGLGFIRAINWATTLYLSRMQVTARTALVALSRNGEGIADEELIKLVSGGQFDFLRIKITGSEGYKLSDFVEQFKLDSGVVDLEKTIAICTQQFEKATGLYDLLYAGQTATQIRTAEDAKMKDANSKTRINHMVTQVEKWATNLGIKERFAARYLEQPDDISGIFGNPQAGQAWGYLAPPEDIQQAQQIAQQIQGLLQQPGLPPAMAMQLQQQLATMPVLVDFDKWCLESDITIESGSMRRPDVDQAIDASNQFMNQAFPALMKAQQVLPALSGLAAWAKVNQQPPEFQAAIASAMQNVQMMQQLQAQQMAAGGGAPPQPGPSAPAAKRGQSNAK